MVTEFKFLNSNPVNGIPNFCSLLRPILKKYVEYFLRVILEYELKMIPKDSTNLGG